MNTKHLLTAVFAVICTFFAAFTAHAQNHLPLENSFSFGGGIAGGITECKGDYLDVTGNPVCYYLGAEFRHYFIPAVAVGATYTYVGSNKYHNKMRSHYIAPALTLRLLTANEKQGFWISGGIGYLHYSDKLQDRKYGISTFNQGYFAVSFGLGYEFALAASLGMHFKLDFILADWHSNPDYAPKWSRYDPDEYQSMFNNNLSYITFGISFVFGK